MVSVLSSRGAPALRDYELLDLIAEGSMAAVHRGRRRKDGYPVAIKIPHRFVMANKVLRERFLLEYRAGKEFRHPNVVRMLDCVEEPGNCCLVMELVEGTDLWSRVTAKGPLPEDEAVGIIIQIANGLHEIHQKGIIHRDVKPQNILLAADGTGKLADLGLIKDLEDELGLTCPNKGLGTPNFMAPEQFTDAKHADVRCDVYSLGATLYAAVTGTPPFQASNLSVLFDKKLRNDLMPARKVVPSVSESLDLIIRRSVHCDPQCRPASCLELAQILKAREGPEVRRKPGSGQAARPKQDRRRAVRYPCALATVCEVVTTIHQARADQVDRWNGQILDLSAGGIGLLLDRRFEPGTIADLFVESPDRSVRHQMKMQVVRVIPDGEERWFIGATFQSPLDQSDLRKMLHHERSALAKTRR